MIQVEINTRTRREEKNLLTNSVKNCAYTRQNTTNCVLAALCPSQSNPYLRAMLLRKASKWFMQEM